jgi:transposase
MADNEFQQLSLAFVDEIQRRYEVIRPLVLLKHSSLQQRSNETDIDGRTIQAYMHRFDSDGMLGLIDKRAGNKRQKQIPDQIQLRVVVLKHLYPPLSDREIARIIQNTLGYSLDNKGVRRILERKSLPKDYPQPEPLHYHEYEDPYQARLEIIKLHHQGWTQDSISGFMGVDRKTIYRIIEHFAEHHFAGLVDGSKAPDHPSKKLTLPTMARILEIQKERPQAGSFRVGGILEREGIQLSDRTIRTAMALNRAAYSLPPTVTKRKKKYEDVVKDMPYVPSYPHQYWFMDIRYVVQLEEQWIYSIVVLEGYSRKILAGTVSYSKDLVVVLSVLYCAMQARGLPEAIVTNGDAVFRAETYIQLCDERLGIERKLIEKARPWQDLVEPLFGVQRRLEDHQFSLAVCFEQVAEKHLDFIEVYNNTKHWAHRERADGRRTPSQMLSWVMGEPISEEELKRAFYERLFVCTLTKAGYARLQNYYFYVEAGLGRRKVCLWIYQDRLRAEYQELPVAQYACTYEEKSRRIKQLSDPVHFQTRYASPQLFLFDMEEYWSKISKRKPMSRPSRRNYDHAEQLLLFQQVA